MLPGTAQHAQHNLLGHTGNVHTGHMGLLASLESSSSNDATFSDLTSWIRYTSIFRAVACRSSDTAV